MEEYTLTKEEAEEDYNDYLKQRVKQLKEEKESYSNVKDLKDAIDEHDKNLTEKILFDVLSTLYFQDWTRACDYKNMTQEQIIQAYTNTCKEIEKRYNYDFHDDVFGFGTGYGEEDY